ncbi:MAG TPA: PaaI family thioesterase [Hydrogenophaga sp.]
MTDTAHAAASQSAATALDALKQLVMGMPMAQTLGLRFLDLQVGASVMEMPYSDRLSFVPGVLQATPVFALADFAAVAAAGSTLPAGWRNATTDTTLKLVAPAKGQVFRARGKVLSVRKTQTVCAADVFAVADDGQETLCATMLATATNLPPAR